MAVQQEAPKTAAKPSKPSDPKAPAAAKASGDPAKPARKRGKLGFVVAILVVVLLGGGGAGAYFLLPGEDESAEAVAAKDEPALFVPLEVFTVNLLPADGLHQYLQTNVTLKVTSQTTADAVKTRMPEVRNRVLMILSAKRPNELMPVAGKQKLATEIGEAVNGMVERPKAADKNANESPAPAVDAKGAPATDGASANGNGSRPQRSVEVLFTSFIIQ
jgi:flagellar protein FliL